MIISRTPFRISFFGVGTDYPAWYRKHSGAVLGADRGSGGTGDRDKAQHKRRTIPP